MANLILLRHGETEYNRDKRMTGMADAMLTQKGKDEAIALGELLEDFNIDKAYASTLTRSFNTAAKALNASKRHHGMPVEARSEIVEQCVGDFTGVRKADRKEVVTKERTFDTCLPNGETFREVVARVGKFYEEELKPRLEKGEDVMVSCHSGVMRAFKYYLGAVNEKEAFEIKVPNAQPWVVEHDGSGNISKHYDMPLPQTPRNDNKAPKPSRR